MLEHLRERIARHEKRQAELDSQIAHLDERIGELETGARDTAPDIDVMARIGTLHRQLADLLYELGAVDARLDDVRERAGALEAPRRALPSQRLRAWSRS